MYAGELPILQKFSIFVQFMTAKAARKAKMNSTEKKKFAPTNSAEFWN